MSAIDRTVVKRPLEKDLKQTIDKRNKRLIAFLDAIGLDAELVGDMETPAIVKDDFCLSCYVHNFNLIFTTQYEKGTELYRIKLQKEQTYELEPITNWLQTAVHRRVYKIKMNDKNLWIVGYNFGDKNKPEEKYPVFGKYAPKIFFTEEYAQQILDLYNLDFCEIV
jgi:hypothetical protein